MPKSEFTTTYEQFYEELKGTEYLPLFQPFFDAVKNADDTMSGLHRRDRYGRIPVMTQQHKEQLLRLHEALGKEAETLIGNADVPENKKHAVKKIAGLASAYYLHLQRYDPATDPRSLPELLEDARTLTLDTRWTELKEKVGSNQNSRQPLTFLDDKGREITGVFTPKKIFDGWKTCKDYLDEQAKNNKKISAEGKEILRTLMDQLETPKAAQLLGLPENADRSARLAAIYEQIFQKTKDNDELAKETAKLIAGLYSTPEKPMTPEQAEAILGKRGLYAFGIPLEKQGTAILNNCQIAKMHDGARLDNRNAAMSAVAELLNVPNLLARSVPMKIIDKNGNEVEGTFMQEAVGTDYGNLKETDIYLDPRVMTHHDGRALKSIADLQVLDFICGNTDRHGANVTYIFDDDGMIIGVQGFDNDTAFGTLVPEYGDFVAFMTLPENMIAVSESMTARLNQLTPEMLKFSLRGYGLTEEELDAAVARMNIVKKAIERGALQKQQGEKKEAAQPAEEKKDGVNEAEKKESEVKEPEKKGSEVNEPEKKESEVKEPEKKEPGKKKAKKEATLTVLKDQDWEKVPWNKLGRNYTSERYNNGRLKRDDVDGNLFTRAWKCVKSFRAAYRQQGRDYESLKNGNAIGDDNRANPRNIDLQLRNAETMDRELGRRSEFGRSSGKYKAMQASVREYRQFFEDLKKRVADAKKDLKTGIEDLSKELDAVVTMEDLAEIHRLTLNMKKAATDYLGTKDPDKQYEPYTERRIEIANTIKSYADKGASLSAEETETAERNERRAAERVNRKLGDKQEAKEQKEQWVIV